MEASYPKPNPRKRSFFNKETGLLLDVVQPEAVQGNPRSRDRNTTNLGTNASITSGYNHPLKPHSTEYIDWGSNNRFPNDLMQLNSRNPVSNGLINTKADFVAGREIILYRKIIEKENIIREPIRNAEIEDWLEENDTKTQLNKWTFDYIQLGNYFLQARRAKSRTKIARINHFDPTLFRVGKVKNGLPKDYLMADWANTARADGLRVPAFDPEKPLSRSVSIMHGKNYHPGSYYYGLPDWIGAENFIRLLNEIPVWHLSGMKNGYNIRWHIEVPASYFDKFLPEKRKGEEQKLRDEMNDFLSGSEQNAKAIVTKFFLDSNQKKIPGVIVTPLKAELYDRAFTDLFEQGMIAVCSAHGINPTLAGVIINGQLSSGSELRNAYNVYLQLKVPRFRDAILWPLYKAKKANNWPREIDFGLIGHQITKLDENGEGATEMMQ